MSTSSLPRFTKIHQAVLDKKSKMQILDERQKEWPSIGWRDRRRIDKYDGLCMITEVHLSCCFMCTKSTSGVARRRKVCGGGHTNFFPEKKNKKKTKQTHGHSGVKAQDRVLRLIIINIMHFKKYCVIMFNFYISIKVVLKGGSGVLPQKILYGNRYKFGLF